MSRQKRTTSRRRWQAAKSSGGDSFGDKHRVFTPRRLKLNHLDALVTPSVIANLTGFKNVEAVAVPQITNGVIGEHKRFGIAFIHAQRKQRTDVFPSQFRRGDCDLDRNQRCVGPGLQEFGVFHKKNLLLSFQEHPSRASLCTRRQSDRLRHYNTN